MKRNPEEGFQRKQRKLFSFLFSSWLKSDSESPIRATGLQNSSDEKDGSLTTVFADGFDWEAQRHKHADVWAAFSPTSCLSLQFKVSFSPVRVYSATVETGALPFVLVDDFGGELMKGGAETRKVADEEKKKHQRQLWDADYCRGRNVCAHMFMIVHWRFC